MKIKDISIRRKMIFSNLVMLIMPVIVVIIITTTIVSGISYFLTGNFSISQSFGVLSLYTLQANFGDLENELTARSTDLNAKVEYSGMIDFENPPKNISLIKNIKINESGSHKVMSERAMSICENLQNETAVIYIVLGEEVVYLTKGFTESDVEKLFREITGSDVVTTDSILSTSDKGTLLFSMAEPVGGEPITLIYADSQRNKVVSSRYDSVSKNLMAYTDKVVILFCVVAAVVILLTNGVFNTFFSRSMLKPLSKLQRATQMIRDGNLDYEVEYSSKNEIGQVCSDFEEMRMRLKQSVEDRRRYEENRMEMIAGVSHDLATPLTTIKGYASGLIDGIADTPQKKNHYLRTIYNTADDLDRLASDLSTFSKLDLDIIPFYYEKVDLPEFFDEVYISVSARLRENGITFYHLMECNPGIIGYIDQAQIRRVIHNLIENCIKYKKNDAVENIVSITVVLTEDMRICVTVEDNGVGVLNDEYDKIFESFYRSDKARSNVRKGSGLGLSITKQIIERHRGTIEAKKSDLGGLKLVIELPVAEIKGDDNKNQKIEGR